MPAYVTDRPVFQVTPEPDARALPTRHGLADERAWLRSTLPTEFEAASAEVAGMLARHPGFRPGPDTPHRFTAVPGMFPAVPAG